MYNYLDMPVAIGNTRPMMILAIDPGTTHSGYVLYDSDAKRILDFGKPDNKTLIDSFSMYGGRPKTRLVVEMIKSYGNIMGDTVLETIVWIGRYLQEWKFFSDRLHRKAVVTHLCNTPRAKDKNVRAEVINRFGGDARIAIGTKKNKGPLYGISGDMWQAIGLAIAWSEIQKIKKNELLG